MKRTLSALAATALLAGSASASAQDGFDVQSFNLAPAMSVNYLNLQQARTLRAGQYELGLMFNYANDPLVFEDGNGDRQAKLVRNLLSGHLMAGVGIADRLELAVDIGLTMLQDSDVPDGSGLFDGGAGFGIGDIRVIPKVLLFGPPHGRDSGPALALSIDTYLPTGDQDTLQGGGFRVEPRLAFDYVFGSGARWGLNLGYFIRPEAEFANVEIDDAITYGTALDIPLGSRGVWHMVPEIRGETGIGVDDLDIEESPLEIMLGYKVFAAERLLIAFGGGTGLISGVGTPDFRVFAGLSCVRPFVEEEELPPVIVTVRDDCPNEPEDEDGFMDEDGCPDPDNDQDNVLDVDDECPMSPEDIDGFEDEDGCPDPDNDQDNVLDVDDECPTDAEDVDTYQDEDGCPDPDNDQDGILDVDDECPLEAEDFDGQADEDGCPEQTNVTCNAIELEGTVNFATNSDVIESSSHGLLDELADVLTSTPEIHLVEVGGHTDDRGSSRYNRDLSQRRVDAVAEYLVAAGVEPSRLEAIGYGEATPVASNSTDDGLAANRRVEVRILESDLVCEE
jgi:outer membrane protein OmpA-like peptidoglycan-associated protein